MNATVRVKIVEEQPLLLDALASLVSGIASVEVAKVLVNDRGDLENKAVEGLDEADVVVLDPCPRGRANVELIQSVQARWPDARLVGITSWGDAGAFGECLSLGVRSLLLKTEAPETIRVGIEFVCRGGVAYSLPAASSVAALPVKSRSNAALPFPIARGLSVREIEILQMVARGYTDPEIAEALSLSPRTVSRHMTNILNKLNCRSRSQAVAEVIGREPALAHKEVSRPIVSVL